MVLKASYPGVVKGIVWNSILLFSWKGISWELQLWEVIGIQIGRGNLQIRLFGLVSTPLKKPDKKNGWKHWKTQSQLRLRRYRSIPSDRVTFPYSNLISQWKENIPAPRPHPAQYPFTSMHTMPGAKAENPNWTRIVRRSVRKQTWHRKWRETKHQLNWRPSLALLGCCLVPLRFQWGVLHIGMAQKNTIDCLAVFLVSSFGLKRNILSIWASILEEAYKWCWVLSESESFNARTVSSS